MLQRIKSYLKYGSYYCGVELGTKNGEPILYASLLKKSKNVLDIITSRQLNTINDLKEKLPKQQHLTLIINDDNIITKHLESKQNDKFKLVYKAFPNINIEDFLFEVLPQGDNHFISICRKDYIQGIIEKYNELGLSVINISLGNSIISSISDWVDKEQIVTSNSHLAFKNKQLLSIEKHQSSQIINYEVNGLKTNSKGLLSLAGGLTLLLGNNILQSNYETEKQNLLDTYGQKRFYNLFLKSGLAFIFGLLLINFLLFNHYFNAVNELQQTTQLNRISKDQIMLLSDKVGKTQKLVDDVLKSSSSKSSYFTNAIMQTLPETMLLTELNYQPLQKRIKNEEDISINKGVIILKGESNDSPKFSNWIAELELIEWVQKVNILEYADQTKQKAVFELTIVIKHE